MHSRKLIDSYGREVNYLRISLTDRCNFRCVYCMPPEGISCLPKKDILSDEDIVRFATLACRLGITRIRLTGGEPLLRPSLLYLVKRLSTISGLVDLGITTNGSRLETLAEPLHKAGLRRINISLDSLDEKKFQQITLSNAFHDVMAGIEKAISLGFFVKINVVVLKGMNDEEILSFVRLALNENVSVRFIEFMPLCGTGWKPELVYPLSEVKELIRFHFYFEERDRGDFVAQSFVVSDGVKESELGFIATLSEPFCNSCSRIRLTADGKIRSCLFSKEEYSVFSSLQDGVSDSEIEKIISEAVKNKPRGSDFSEYWDQHNSLNFNIYAGRESETPKIRSIGG